MNGAIAPFNTQMAKQKSKYRNSQKSVGGCPDFQNVLADAITLLLLSRLTSFYDTPFRDCLYAQNAYLMNQLIYRLRILHGASHISCLIYIIEQRAYQILQDLS